MKGKLGLGMSRKICVFVYNYLWYNKGRRRCELRQKKIKVVCDRLNLTFFFGFLIFLLAVVYEMTVIL